MIVLQNDKNIAATVSLPRRSLKADSLPSAESIAALALATASVLTIFLAASVGTPLPLLAFAAAFCAARNSISALYASRSGKDAINKARAMAQLAADEEEDLCF